MRLPAVTELKVGMEQTDGRTDVMRPVGRRTHNNVPRRGLQLWLAMQCVPYYAPDLHREGIYEMMGGHMIIIMITIIIIIIHRRHRLHDIHVTRKL